MRYYSLSTYCKNTYKEKLYRLSLNGGMTCPNRDGTLSTGGCAFCSEGGSGDFAESAALSITEQIERAKQRISRKSQCQKYIAYFQAFTNTYAPVPYLRRIFTEAMEHPEIAVLSIATRSDCLDEEVIALLCELNRKKPVWIELGLQSIHARSLEAMNTHTTVEQFDRAVDALSTHNLAVIAHLILGLPGESREDMLASVRHIARLPVSGVKLQLLHILSNTILGKQFQQAPFSLMEREEYCDLVIDCVELLPPDMVIHRLTGDGPKQLLLAPQWSADKKKVLNCLNRRFEERDAYQGRLFVPQSPPLQQKE